MKSVARSLFTLATLGLAVALPSGVAYATPVAAHHDDSPVNAHGPHGFVQILEAGLDELTLRADQIPAIEQLVNQLEPLQVHVDMAENNLLLALAEQVRTGKIERMALDAQVQGYIDARIEVSKDLRTTVQSLHSLLDPAQRLDLADAMEARVHAIRQAILSGQHIDELAAALHLREDQIQLVRAGLASITPALEGERTALHRVLEAFREGDFQIEAVLPSAQVTERARQRAEMIIDLTASLAGILDAAQRDVLAERIEMAARARAGLSAHGPGVRHPRVDGEEPTGEADEAWVAARGPRGGVFVRGPAGFAYGRVRAFPYTAAWGFGW